MALGITHGGSKPSKGPFRPLIILGRSSTALSDSAAQLFATFLTHSCSTLCHFCVTFVTLKSSHLNSNSIGIRRIPGVQFRHRLCRLSDQPRVQKSARKWVPLLGATFGHPFSHPAQPNPYRILPRAAKIHDFGVLGLSGLRQTERMGPLHSIPLDLTCMVPIVFHEETLKEPIVLHKGASVMHNKQAWGTLLGNAPWC